MFGLTIIEKDELERLEKQLRTCETKCQELFMELEKEKDAHRHMGLANYEYSKQNEVLQLENKVLKENDEDRRNAYAEIYKDNSKLKRENEELRSRLAQAEEYIRTIDDKNLQESLDTDKNTDHLYYEINMDTLTTDKVAYGDVTLDYNFVSVTDITTGKLLYARKTGDIIRISLKERVNE